MKLVAFVLHVSNEKNHCQQYIYETYLKHFDVVDAVMCRNNECLAVCVSPRRPNCVPQSFYRFRKFISKEKEDDCDLRIIDIDCYSNLESLVTTIHEIMLNFNP
ncbi:ac117 [Sucra jujuba nucleopolyhedrovirus]|uniref:Ac117 n=1 Tax=Sucra jujuba nucleopolyhedrovirus TaxID=1563660 RepID=A0A097P934_9ABAC|nr:ac117 [Sucra jujuba nucleopolyhedrovirus]AIU41342.1 ac117 [Sucra jujuba nucleopolyhedrovirus]